MSFLGCDPLLTIVCATTSTPDAMVSRSGLADLLRQGGSLVELVVVTPSDSLANLTNSLAQSLGGAVFVVPDTGVGVYAAMNEGLRSARGHFIMFINDDDWINVDGCLQACRDHFEGPECVIYGDTLLHDLSHGMTWRIDGSASSSAISQARMPASHQAQILPRSLLIRERGFMDSLTFGPLNVRLVLAADFEFFARTHETCPWIYDSRIQAHQTFGGMSTRRWLRATLECEFIAVRYRRQSHFRLGRSINRIVGSVRWHTSAKVRSKSALGG